MSDILKSQWRKARKRHVCSFCNQYIEPGERYKYEPSSTKEACTTGFHMKSATSSLTNFGDTLIRMIAG